MNKKKMSSHAWYKIFVYVAMIVFAISIIVPVAWVFLSSVKSQLDLVGDPWSMPTQFLWSNFVDAMEKARMGEYFINSLFVTVLGLIFLLVLAGGYALNVSPVVFVVLSALAGIVLKQLEVKKA